MPNGHRVEWVWGDDPMASLTIAFTDMDPNDPPRNIRVFEVKHEALLDAGELFNPEWIEKVRAGSGIVRFMDWQQTNYNVCTLRFSDIPSEKFCSYGGDTAIPSIKNGMPLSVMARLADQVQSHPWVCIPAAFGTRQLTAITGITTSNRVSVTSPGHAWQNGDRVLVWHVSGMTQLNQTVHTVTNVDANAGTLELPSIDSSKLPRYTGSGFLATPYDFGDLTPLTQEVAPLAAYFRDHVDSNLTTYFELSNETWNSIFNQFHWFNAQGRQLYGRNGFGNHTAGYIAAHCMRVIRDTYGVESRRRWRGILPTQTVNTRVTLSYITGINRYLRDHAPDLTLTDLFDDVAVTGYFGGHFTDVNKLAVFRWMDVSERRWRRGLEPTKYSYFNRIVNEDLMDARHTGMRYSLDQIGVFWQTQKKISDAHGLGLIQYEGGNHNNANFSPDLLDGERIRFMEFYRNCNHTPEDAANYAAMFSRFVELGGRYPSKFVEARPVVYWGAWGGLRYLGDMNPVWDSVVRFNARS